MDSFQYESAIRNLKKIFPYFESLIKDSLTQKNIVKIN